MFETPDLDEAMREVKERIERQPLRTVARPPHATITEAITTFAPRQLSVSPKTIYAFTAASACICDPTTLSDTYEVISDFFSGIVDINADSLDQLSCADISWSGENDSGVVVTMAIEPSSNVWAVAFDNFGTVVILFKIPGSGNPPDCDIASPAGLYEGDGYTATVQTI